jgi:hypothetical protein
MISAELAMKHVMGHTAEEVRRLVTERLTGKDTAPVGSAYSAEPPEDLIIQLLRHGDIAPDIRSAVLAGIKDVLGIMVSTLVSGGLVDDPAFVEMATRSCRVLDIAAPVELQGRTLPLLAAVLDIPGVPKGVRTAAVRAAMAYSQTADQIYLWERVLKSPDLAAYGFQALLAIDPHSVRVEEALKELWRRQIIDRWPVDAAFLTRRAARAQGSEAIVRKVLSSLRAELAQDDQGRRYWQQIETELVRRDWSCHWLKAAALPARGVPYGRQIVNLSRSMTLQLPMMYQFESRGSYQHQHKVEIYTEFGDFKTRKGFNELLEFFADNYHVLIQPYNVQVQPGMQLLRQSYGRA